MTFPANLLYDFETGSCKCLYIKRISRNFLRIILYILKLGQGMARGHGMN